MKNWTIEIKVSVSDNWIADGFDPSTKAWKESIEEAILNLLPYSIYDVEMKAKVKVVKAPDPKVIAELQGYSSVSSMRRDNPTKRHPNKTVREG
jgi:hypothetical protein